MPTRDDRFVGYGNLALALTVAMGKAETIEIAAATRLWAHATHIVG